MKKENHSGCHGSDIVLSYQNNYFVIEPKWKSIIRENSNKLFQFSTYHQTNSIMFRFVQLTIGDKHRLEN